MNQLLNCRKIIYQLQPQVSTTAAIAVVATAAAASTPLVIKVNKTINKASYLRKLKVFLEKKIEKDLKKRIKKKK